MKPRKKWEPEYRFGGNKASFWSPRPLGQASGWGPTKNKIKKGKRK